MALTIVSEDSAYKCGGCAHTMQVKKGQLLPPCPRCGAAMEKYDGPVSAAPDCR